MDIYLLKVRKTLVRFNYNNLGELVLNDNNLNKYKSLDLSHLTKGTYYIKLNINNEIIKRKIILK